MNQNQNQNITISKLLLYLPVIHSGYINVLEKYPESEVLILDESLISLIDEEFDYLRKEIRSLTPNQAKLALEALFPKRKISLLSVEKLLEISSQQTQEKQKYIFPNEDIFIWLQKKYLKNSTIEFESTFLRWNRNNSAQKQQVESSVEITESEFSKKMMKVANNQKDLSSDWWRQVGAVVIKNVPGSSSGETNKEGEIIAIAHNTQLPTPYTPYIDSDPRNSFHKGKNIDVSTAIHAEAALISQAAKDGISLLDTEIYITTFPCSACAKLIACSGISKLYFTDGYSMVDGDKILKKFGVEVIRIKN
ncbi:hypothetical protein KKD03_01210 [Patescibacteria group bacterium]|nr:hypothetical protein [Patescibacteria group bacterium]